jgi:hypothetical protein
MNNEILAASVVYAAGFGAFGWSYIQNGVFLAWDQRPWWLATIHIVLWPVVLPIDLLRAWRS